MFSTRHMCAIPAPAYNEGLRLRSRSVGSGETTSTARATSWGANVVCSLEMEQASTTIRSGSGRWRGPKVTVISRRTR